MKIKPAVWMASLAFSLALPAGGVCLAQTGLTNAAEGLTRKVAYLAPNDLFLPAPATNSIDEAEDRTDENAISILEEAGSEAAASTPKSPGRIAFTRVGIGVKVSTLGAGIEVATPLAGKLNLRGGFNILRFSRPITDSGIHYVGQLHFQSAEAHLDWFPFWGFHISPGLLFYNGNELQATASVPAGQTFTVGGTTYESDQATPVTGTGKLDFVKVSPSIMLGVGNLVPRNGRHFSFLFEAGAAYQGSARVALNLAGSVCDTSGSNCRAVSSDPTVQSNIQAQQVKIQHDINPYRFFPVVSFGVGFNF
jgi:hypothetical protein